MRKRSLSFLFMLIMIGTITLPMLAQHLSLDVRGDKVSNHGELFTTGLLQLCSKSE